MNLYETTFIINPQADDAAIDRQIKAVTDLISNGGGKILHEDRQGTKRMAYEIAGLTQGYYTSLYFESPPTVPSTLDKHFKLEDPYIRHLTVVFEGDLEAVKEARTAVGISADQDDEKLDDNSDIEKSADQNNDVERKFDPVDNSTMPDAEEEKTVSEPLPETDEQEEL